VLKQKPTYTKRQNKQRQEDKKERRWIKRQGRRTGSETTSPESPVENTNQTEGMPQCMTKQEILETIKRLRENFARLMRNKDKSDPAVRQVIEEFNESNQRYLDWEDRFPYRIGAAVYHLAEVSFVGEETAHRCGWHVRRLPRKKALTGTDGAIATGIVDVPIRISKQTLGLQLFVSPHIEDFLVLGRDVVSRVLVHDERLILTLNNGKVLDTLSDDPFSVVFEATYLDENDGWRIGELKPEIGAREAEVHSITETHEIVQLPTTESA